MNDDAYVHDVHIVWAILATIDALPLDELRLQNARHFATIAFSPPDLYARTLIAIREDGEAFRILRIAQRALRDLKAGGDGRRRRTEDPDRDHPNDAPAGARSV